MSHLVIVYFSEAEQKHFFNSKLHRSFSNECNIKSTSLSFVHPTIMTLPSSSHSVKRASLALLWAIKVPLSLNVLIWLAAWILCRPLEFHNTKLVKLYLYGPCFVHSVKMAFPKLLTHVLYVQAKGRALTQKNSDAQFFADVF